MTRGRPGSSRKFGGPGRSQSGGIGLPESRIGGEGRPESGQFGLGGPKMVEFDFPQPGWVEFDLGRPGSVVYYSLGSDRPGSKGRPKADDEGRPVSRRNGDPAPFDDVFKDVRPYQGGCALAGEHQ